MNEVNKMMDNMFRSMSVEDRIQFMETMMPKCLNMMFDEMYEETKERFAKQMIEKLTETLQEQLKHDNTP